MVVAERLPTRDDFSGDGHRLQRVTRRSQDRLADAGSDVGVVTRRAARKAKRQAKHRLADAGSDVGVVTRRAARKAKRQAKDRLADAGSDVGVVTRRAARKAKRQAKRRRHQLLRATLLAAATASVVGAVAWLVRSRRGVETAEEPSAEQSQISQPYAERRAS